MPIRIEELVFKTIIKTDRESDQAVGPDRSSPSQLGLQQLRSSLVQELKDIATEHLDIDQER